jgi:hypothetical protein
VTSAVAQWLGIKDVGDVTLVEAVKQHMHSKRMLLVIDNFEHVLDVAPLLG